MQSTVEKGGIGEKAAFDYLVKNGYVILDRNFRTKYGEIDIIGKDKGYIAFIEVKSRTDFSMGLPCEAVNKYKQRRIMRMALIYIMEKKLYGCDFRFDVVEVVITDGEVKYLNLIKDAFEADMTF